MSIGINGLSRTQELHEGMLHENQSEFCFAFSLDPIPSNASQESEATALKMCSFSSLHNNSLLCLDHEVHVGMDLCQQ